MNLIDALQYSKSFCLAIDIIDCFYAYRMRLLKVETKLQKLQRLSFSLETSLHSLNRSLKQKHKKV